MIWKIIEIIAIICWVLMFIDVIRLEKENRRKAKELMEIFKEQNNGNKRAED